MMESVYEALDRIEAEAEPEIIPPASAPADGLDYLQSIYRDPSLHSGVRLQAAIAALPFERPKLAVAAHINGDGFGARPERAIERSRKVIEGEA
jgi:hypothetical protein